MLNEFKDFLRHNKPKSDDESKKSKRGFIVIIVVFGIAIANMIIQYVNGDEQYKAETIAYIRNNFHINRIDLTIITVMFIILIIIKIKNKKENK